jgi:hypothetical protein
MEAFAAMTTPDVELFEHDSLSNQFLVRFYILVILPDRLCFRTQYCCQKPFLDLGDLTPASVHGAYQTYENIMPNEQEPRFGVRVLCGGGGNGQRRNASERCVQL